MKTNHIQFLVAILCAAFSFWNTGFGYIYFRSHRRRSHTLEFLQLGFFFLKKTRKPNSSPYQILRTLNSTWRKKDFSLSLRYFSALKQWQWFGCRGNYLYYERGQAYYGLGQYDQAISDLKHLSSKDLEGQTRLGACYYRLKQYEKAIAVEGSILSKDANCTEARKIRGMAFL